MKEILAILRLNKVRKTKIVLENSGFSAFTCRRVLGRGKNPLNKTSMLLPKKAFIIIVNDYDVNTVVNIIMDVNCTENCGDGKIFVMPVSESYKVSTGEGGTYY